jgi:hypothetical protein
MTERKEAKEQQSSPIDNELTSKLREDGGGRRLRRYWYIGIIGFMVVVICI